jgi:hypothetical protein
MNVIILNYTMILFISSSNNLFSTLANVLKRCDLTVVTPVSSTLTSIVNDAISTTNWQEMTIFDKVTVLRALCDTRLNRADVEQVIEVSRCDRNIDRQRVSSVSDVYSSNV